MDKINLVSYFIAVNQKPTIALNVLNRTLKTSYNLSRLGEWRNGKRPVPDPVRRLMLDTILPLALGSYTNCTAITDKRAFFLAIEPPLLE